MQHQQQTQSKETSLLDNFSLFLFFASVATIALCLHLTVHPLGSEPFRQAMAKSIIVLATLVMPLCVYARRPLLLHVLKRELLG